MNAHASQMRKSTRALVAAIKDNDQDFEWYPSTQEMLSVIKQDIDTIYTGHNANPSVLDCGAGDGRALEYLTKGDRYAIEKCQTLIHAMDNSIFIVGTEFTQQTLIDKKTQIVFSNPPYSQYVSWCLKLILESNCQHLYLIIPQRWKTRSELSEAIDRRKATAQVLGSFDFTDADRAARAKVDIIRIDLGYNSRHRDSESKIDPFDLWFDSEFSIAINKEAVSKHDWDARSRATQREAINSALVAGGDIIGVLVELYLQELTHLMCNYRAIETLDPDVLNELDVNIDGIKKALRMKVEGLKDRYWKELFDNMGKITTRLTTSAREKMLDKLMKHTHVDFTASNAHALLIWVIKNANSYYDTQLINLVERITENTSIVMYASNQRVFTNEDWRYRRTPDDLSRYCLDYRIVLSRVGGLCRSDWQWDRDRFQGLSESAFICLSDILTVANNLQFDTSRSISPKTHYWASNKAVEFTFTDSRTGDEVVLMSVRAFLNGNLHIKFNQLFIQRLNVEFGRLKGWLKNTQEAAIELKIAAAEASDSFGSNLQLNGTGIGILSFNSAIR